MNVIVLINERVCLIIYQTYNDITDEYVYTLDNSPNIHVIFIRLEREGGGGIGWYRVYIIYSLCDEVLSVYHEVILGSLVYRDDQSHTQQSVDI